jgi:hypothetical protein
MKGTTYMVVGLGLGLVDGLLGEVVASASTADLAICVGRHDDDVSGDF